MPKFEITQFAKFIRPSHAILINQTGILFKGPCLLVSIAVTGDGAVAEADFYDGLNDQGEHKYKIKALSNTTFHASLNAPTDFDTGIYVVVNDVTTYVTVQYIPLYAGRPE